MRTHQNREQEQQILAWATRVRAAESGAPVPEASPDLPTTRDELRSRRARGVRRHTVSIQRLSKSDVIAARAELADVDLPVRPRTRGECAGVSRPCPFVSCRHHLYLEVSRRNGSIQLNFPDLEVWELRETCALDVADLGGLSADGATLEEVGQALNVTRERVRQIEVRALAKVEQVARRPGSALGEHVDGEVYGRRVRRLPVLTDDTDGEDDAEAGE